MERCRGGSLVAFLTLASEIALLHNLCFPAERCGYEMELVALVAIGLTSLAISLKSSARGLLFYGYASLLPVLMMMYRQVGLGGNHSSLQYVPVVGVAIVAVFTLSRNAIFNYALWAATANGATILIYHDVGKAVLWGWTILAAGLSMYICSLFNKQTKHQIAIRKTQREIEGAIQETRGELREALHGTK